MNMIEKARELGREIQASEAYIKVMSIKEACDEDKGLQEAIGELNLKRMSINNEAQKEERNEEKIKQLNDEFREIYQTVTQNENLLAYNQAKTELDGMVQRITGIITLCGDGMDPETADYEPPACGGECSSCSGCS